MRYVLAINCHTSAASRIQPGACAEAISAALTRGGFQVDGTPNVVVVNLDSPFLSTERSVVSAGIAVTNETLTPLQIRYIDATVARVINDAASGQWSITAIVRALPPTGSGSGRVTLTGGVTEVQRSLVRGRGVPNPTPRTVITGRVAQSNAAEAPPGIEVDSRERSIIRSAGNVVSAVTGATSTVIIPVAVAAVAVSAAIIIYKVKS